MTTAAEQREIDKTLPPTTIAFADANRPIVYAEAYDDEGLAGFVWMTVDRDHVPRAGIVLVTTGQRDPSIALQEDLGEVTLRERDNDEVGAHEFLTYLAETRDGLGGKVSIHDVRVLATLASLRSMAGQ